MPAASGITRMSPVASSWGVVSAAVRCERNLVANVVALDQPLMFNRLGAQNANGMMFALRRDVVDDHEMSLAQGGAAVPGKVSLRPDKRPRPLVLRVAAGDCLTINLQNLLDETIYDSTHNGQFATVAPGRVALLTTNFRF